MYKFRELDFDIMEAIQNTPDKRLYFSDIAHLSDDTAKLYKIVEKLVKRNFISKDSDYDGIFYFIKEDNLPMNIEKVRCPICKTIRRFYRSDQKAVYCRNPDCRTSSGRRRVFWLINIDHWYRGDIKKINRIN